MSRTRFGTVIRKLRDGLGMTQRDLAKIVGVSGAYITMLETGKRKNPSFVILRRLARVLEVELWELLE